MIEILQCNSVKWIAPILAPFVRPSIGLHSLETNLRATANAEGMVRSLRNSNQIKFSEQLGYSLFVTKTRNMMKAIK